MYVFEQEEIDAVVRVLKRKSLFRYIEGARGEVDCFEEELARAFEISYGILVTSGTAALICGLAAMGVGPGDEVIVPAYTYEATALAPLAVGAVPVICEIDESLTIDPVDLEKKIGPKTCAIIPVHMNGFPSNMQAILEIAKQHDLYVLEDACQAIGGKYQGKFLGTLGEIGVFSFQQRKILTAGEGGAIITNRRRLYERAFIHHDGTCDDSPYGATFEHPLFAGWAFRANEITGAILRVQLQRLGKILTDFRKHKNMLESGLSEFQGLTPLPCHDPQGECATHLAYQFSTSTEAETFCRLANQAGIYAMYPGTSKYSYSHWQAILNRNGAHHPQRDPLLSTNRTHHVAMCPQSTDILSRTALLACEQAVEPGTLSRFINLIQQERALHLT